MSRASNSLRISDVTATPIKLKYSASYSNTTICDSGIYAQSGLNGPVTVTGSVPQRTLRYWSIRHLFYSNFLTGSYLTTTSSLDNSLQSTAASGTFEGNTTLSASADIRYFPTESNAKIKIINIPRSSYGEKTSRKSFSLVAADNTSYHLEDDGNGNVYDLLNGNVHVGNIIYAEGFVIITNPDYYCAMDGGPFTFPKSYIFDITQSVKSFNPISDAQADCAPVDPTTLTLITASGFLFPSSSQSSLGLVTLSESDPLTNIVGTYRDYYTVDSTYCASSDKQPITVNIVDCSVTNGTATALSCSINGLTLTLQPSPTPTATIRPTCTPTPTPSPTVTGTPTPSPSPTPSVTPTPTPTPSVTIPPPTATLPPPTPTATIPPPTPGPTPTPTPSPTVRPPITGSATVSTVSGPAACAGGESPFNSPPYTYYIPLPGYTLCDATEIFTTNSTYDWINAEIANNIPFYVSDRIDGVFYYRQFTKPANGSTADPTGDCTICAGSGTPTPTATPIPQRNVRVFADRPGNPSTPVQYLEYSLSTSPTSWVTSCDNINAAESLTPYVTIAVDNGVNVNLRVYDATLGDRVEMDYAFLPATTPSTTYYATATTNNQNDCGPSITITQDTDIYVKTSTTGCGIFPADPCATPAPTTPP
jgi:hypothetical protein